MNTIRGKVRASVLSGVLLALCLGGCGGSGGGGPPATGGSSSGGSGSSSSSGSSGGSSSSSSGASAFYIPFFNSFQSLFVEASNALSPNPTELTGPGNGFVGRTGLLLQPTQNDGAGHLGGFTPSGFLYSAANGSYYADLSVSSGGGPAATAMGGAAAESSNPCADGFTPAELADLTDGGSGFIITHLAGPDRTCFTADDQFAETSTASPRISTLLPINGKYSYLTSFYGSPSGKLTGILETDGQGNLKLFPDLTFSSSTLLMSANSPVIYTSAFATAAYAFITVTTGTSSAVYRVDRSGAVSGPLYTSQPNGNVQANAWDANNLYFSDVLEPTLVVKVVQVALSGTSPAQVLYVYNNPSTPPCCNGTAPGFNVWGVTDTQQLVLGTCQGSAANVNTVGTLETVAAGSFTTTPTVISSAAQGCFNSVIVQGSQIFTTLQTTAPVAGSTTYSSSFTKEIFNPDGTLVSAVPGSAIVGPQSYLSSIDLNTGAAPYVFDNLMVVQGITATDGSYGGGTFYNESLSGSDTPLLNASGASNMVPGGYIAGMSFIGATAGYGQEVGITSTLPWQMFVYNLSSNELVPLAL